MSQHSECIHCWFISSNMRFHPKRFVVGVAFSAGVFLLFFRSQSAWIAGDGYGQMEGGDPWQLFFADSERFGKTLLLWSSSSLSSSLYFFIIVIVIIHLLFLQIFLLSSSSSLFFFFFIHIIIICFVLVCYSLRWYTHCVGSSSSYLY